jgi:hypothetical protein
MVTSGSPTMIAGFHQSCRVLTIIWPETLLRWHRAGFRCYWRWKSRPAGGRPQIDTELRLLIRRMNVENPLWGAPRIHVELLKLGFEVASRASPSTWSNGEDRQGRGCRTFLHNSAPDIAAMDLFVSRPLTSTCSMPSSSCDSIVGPLVDQRHNQPDSGAGCTQITEAFPWDGAPGYMIRDRDEI